MHSIHTLFVGIAVSQFYPFCNGEVKCDSLGNGISYNGFRTQCNNDGGGPFYREFDVTGMEDCINQCSQDPRCQTIGYYAPRLRCYLKAYTLEQRPAYSRISDIAIRINSETCKGFGDGYVSDGFIAKCQYDGGGPSYQELGVVDFKDCIEKCKADARCHSVGYNGESDGTHLCYLKEGSWRNFDIYPKAGTDFAAELDPKICLDIGDRQSFGGFVARCGYDGGGPFYQQLDVAHFKDCMDKCNADPRCRSAGYYDRDRHCYLKSGTFEKYPVVARADTDLMSKLPLASPIPTPSCNCWVTEYDDSSTSVGPTPVPTPVSIYLRRDGGCFSTSEVRPDHFFPHQAPDNTIPNTREPCATKCYEAGYRVYALTAGVKCYCGNQYPRGTTRNADTSCQTDRAAVIHAGTTYEVFQALRFLRINCFTLSERRSQFLFRTIDTVTDNDRESCSLSCYLAGFAYAAVTQKRQCFCDQEWPYGEVWISQSRCDGGQVNAWAYAYTTYDQV